MISSWEIQRSIYAALTGDITLMSLVTAVYDQVAPSPLTPYVTIGDDTVLDTGGKDFDAATATLTLDIWDEGAGRQTTKEIMDRIRAVLHNQDLVMVGQTAIAVRVASQETVLELDGVTYHGIQRVEMIIHSN